LIERGIRTLSNSLSTIKSNINDVKSTAAQEALEEEATGIKIQTLNKILEQHDQQLINEKNQLSLLDIKELRERWFTKKELNFM